MHIVCIMHETEHSSTLFYVTSLLQAFDMEEARHELGWPACLASRENFLPSDTPHIPITIQDIFRYVSLSDYEENCIKIVQTIGEIIPGNSRLVRFRGISSDCDAEIILSLEKLPINAIYLKDEKGRHFFIWVMH